MLDKYIPYSCINGRQNNYRGDSVNHNGGPVSGIAHHPVRPCSTHMDCEIDVCIRRNEHRDDGPTDL